jgi:DNA invertase Pin-like site-specific DNA recombinase
MEVLDTSIANVALPYIAAGRADAQKRGVRFGRPKKMNIEQQDLAKRLLNEGKSLYRILAPTS